MPEKKETLQKRTHLKNLHRIWKKATSGKTAKLKGEEKIIADILMQHPQFRAQFEMADKLAELDYEPDDVTDAFRHIDIHLAIQGQLDEGEPVDTEIFIETMEAKGISRHEAIHCAGMILTKAMQESVNKVGYFDVYKYKQMLSKLKDSKPEDLEKEL